jgi:hypothetical protein
MGMEATVIDSSQLRVHHAVPFGLDTCGRRRRCLAGVDTTGPKPEGLACGDISSRSSAVFVFDC